MQDLTDEKNVPDDPDLLAQLDAEIGNEKRTGPTGPRTPSGKSRSSLNRLSHGCRSELTILPDEDPEEFEFIVNSWFDQYKPQNADDILFLQETARHHWFFKRASKRLEEIEWHVPGNAWNWTDTHLKLFTNFSRYKTAAERAFLRFYKVLQSNGRANHHALRMDARIELQWLKKQEEKAAEELKAKQWIEVEVVGGKCRTSYYPTNQKLFEEIALRPEKPICVTRWINFYGGIPPEYDWVKPNLLQKAVGAKGVQKMTYADWLDVIEREKAAGTGHFGPISDPNSSSRWALELLP